MCGWGPVGNTYTQKTIEEMADSDLNKVSWDQLISGLRDAFGHDCVNIDEVKQLMTSYESDPSDWKLYSKFDPHRYVMVVYRYYKLCCLSTHK